MFSSSSPSFLAYNATAPRSAPSIARRSAQDRHSPWGGQRRDDGRLRDTSSSGAPRGRAAGIAVTNQKRSGRNGHDEAIGGGRIVARAHIPPARAEPQSMGL